MPQVPGWAAGPPTLAVPPDEMDEGEEASYLPAKYGTDLRGVDAVVGPVMKDGAFDLKADVTIEVDAGAGIDSGIDGLIVDFVDGGVDGMKVAVAGEHVDSRWLRWWGRSCFSCLRSTRYLNEVS